MALLFSDPCDNFTSAPWTVTGTPSVTASGHTGNGFQFGSGSGNYLTYDIAVGNQTDTLTVGCWLKLGTLSGTHNILDFRSDAGATDHAFMRVNANGSLSIVRSTVSPVATSATGLIVTGTWYYVEARVKLHDTAGTADIQLNGANVASATSVDTKNAGTKTVFDQFRVQSGGSITNWFVDDFYLRSDGTFGAAPTVNVYNGTAFVAAPVNVYNGTAFVAATAVKTWNGSAFV